MEKIGIILSWEVVAISRSSLIDNRQADTHIPGKPDRGVKYE